MALLGISEYAVRVTFGGMTYIPSCTKVSLVQQSLQLNVEIIPRNIPFLPALMIVFPPHSDTI